MYAACNDKHVRPLTDYLVVEDPETVPYDIEFTYYISRNTALSASEIEEAVGGRQLISTLHGNVKNSEEILTLTNYGNMLKLQE